MQIKDRIDIIQSLLDSKHSVYRDQALLDSLSNQLGLGMKAQQLDLRVAECAMRAADRELAIAKSLSLVRSGFKPAWEICAQLAITSREDELEAEILKQLLGFVLAHCHSDQVMLASQIS